MSTKLIEVVTKRSGEIAPFDLAKWQAQIAKVCDGVAGISPSMVEIAAQPHFYNKMSTRELDEIALKAMVNLIDEEEHPDVGNTNYQYAAGRHRITMLRKDVFGQYQPPRLFDIIKKNVDLKLYTPELLEWYTEEEWDKIETFVDHSKDEDLPYAAVDQLIAKYLVRNRATGLMVETPQIRYIVAAATAFHAETKDRLRWVKDFYHAASDGQFTLATPVLSGLGTKTKQFSSCVVLRSDDSMDSIFDTGKIMANYAAKRAGIGLEFGRMRPLGAEIRNGEVMHTGILPFLKKWFSDLRSASQGGIRNSSASVNFPIWHYQFDDYIVMKNNKGTEETRVRQLDYIVVMSKFFWRRFAEKGVITFFDPNEVPDLYEAFYRNHAEFEKLYVAYEKRTDLRKKQESAETVIRDWITLERSETGRIYILNIDNVQNQGPYDTSVDPVYQTNLCAEIMIPSQAIGKKDVFKQTVPSSAVSDFLKTHSKYDGELKLLSVDGESHEFEVTKELGRIGLCTLGSMNWGSFKHPEEMRRPARLLHRALHNLLQYQEFLSIHSELHNKEYEPIGIGITNQAYWHAKRKLKYGESDSLAEVKRWMEHQAFYLTQMSVELAKEKGPCWKSHQTFYGKGIFPWERRAEGVNELTDFTPSDELDWEGLRTDMKTYGVRNSTNMAIPPVESSSVVLTSTNGINLVKQLIVSKLSKAGDFVQVVPEYKKLKNHYQLLWDQEDCIGYLKTAAVLQAYVDQGISTDTFYSPKYFPDGKIDITLVIKNQMLAAKWGLKSLYYHLVDKEAAMSSVREEEVVPATVPEIVEEEYCEACVL